MSENSEDRFSRQKSRFIHIHKGDKSRGKISQESVMEEESLKNSIDTYKTQLEQVDQAILAAGETADLVTLRRDLDQLIKLSEDSLLSLRKSRLLKQLGGDNEDNNVSLAGYEAKPQADLDDEYAAFQAMLADDVSTSEPVQGTPASESTAKPVYVTPVSEDTSKPVNFKPVRSEHAYMTHASESTTKPVNFDLEMDRSPALDIPDMADAYQEIIGTKCRAPFVQDWGEKIFSNAMIAAVETESEVEMPKVRVMFCNPSNAAMLPCSYFLEGSCKFTEDSCRYSHGYKVSLEDLLEYEDPDYSQLKLESSCLARYEDDLWYRATVVDHHHDDDLVSVTFDSYSDEVVKLPLEDIWPLGHLEKCDSLEDETEDRVKDGQSVNREDSDDDELPVYLWKPPSQGLGDLGQWEAHTRGIGSRLMSMMGYEPGKGLGRSGEGRVEPVPIQLLPQGKSLDVIMQLREKAGERSVFDVVNKLEKKKKKHEEKLATAYIKPQQPSVFDFINKKLHGKKGKLSELVHKHECQGQGPRKQGQGKIHRTISEHELTKKSDRNINIQLLKTGEEIKSVQKELTRLRQALARNQNKDRTMTAQIQQKIAGMESYLTKLRSSETTMSSHQQKRSDHRKLTVF